MPQRTACQVHVALTATHVHPALPNIAGPPIFASDGKSNRALSHIEHPFLFLHLPIVDRSLFAIYSGVFKSLTTHRNGTTPAISQPQPGLSASLNRVSSSDSIPNCPGSRAEHGQRRAGQRERLAGIQRARLLCPLRLRRLFFWRLTAFAYRVFLPPFPVGHQSSQSTHPWLRLPEADGRRPVERCRSHAGQRCPHTRQPAPRVSG